MQRLFIPILLLVLAGCGAEVAGTAAVVGAAKVKEAQEAQKQKEQIQQRLDAAAELERQRLKAADDSRDGEGRAAPGAAAEGQ